MGPVCHDFFIHLCEASSIENRRCALVGPSLHVNVCYQVSLNVVMSLSLSIYNILSSIADVAILYIESSIGTIAAALSELVLCTSI